MMEKFLPAIPERLHINRVIAKAQVATIRSDPRGMHPARENAEFVSVAESEVDELVVWQNTAIEKNEDAVLRSFDC